MRSPARFSVDATSLRVGDPDSADLGQLGRAALAHCRSPAHRRSRGAQQHEQRPLRLWRSPRGLLRLPGSAMAASPHPRLVGRGHGHDRRRSDRAGRPAAAGHLYRSVLLVGGRRVLHGVDAQIDFGTLDPVGVVGARIVASVGGNKTYPLTYDPSRLAGARTPRSRSRRGRAPCRSIFMGEEERHVRGLTCTGMAITRASGPSPAFSASSPAAICAPDRSETCASSRSPTPLLTPTRSRAAPPARTTS